MIFFIFELCMVQKWIKIMDLILVFLQASLIIQTQMCLNILVVSFFLWLPFSAKAVSIYRLTGRRELSGVSLDSGTFLVTGEVVKNTNHSIPELSCLFCINFWWEATKFSVSSRLQDKGQVKGTGILCLSFKIWYKCNRYLLQEDIMVDGLLLNCQCMIPGQTSGPKWASSPRPAVVML